MKKLNILFLLILILSSCELAIDVGDELDYEAQLVVASVMQPDSLIQVSVARTEFILNNVGSNSLQLIDANVKIYEDDVLLGETSTSVSSEFESYAHYNFPFVAKAGSHYRIEVEKNGYPTAVGEETVLERVSQAELSDLNTTAYGDEFNAWYDVDFEVELDDELGNDYYQITAYAESKRPYYFQTDTGWVSTTDSLMTETYPIYMETNSLAIEDYLFDQIIFDDRLFQGSDFRISFNTDIWFERGDFDPEARILIYVDRLSEAYYNYVTSTELQRWLDGDPFAEPVQIYSNIENGLGFVGSANTLVLEIPFD